MQCMTLIAAAALALGLPAAGAVAQTSLLPGYYEIVTRIAGDPEPDVHWKPVTREPLLGLT